MQKSKTTRGLLLGVTQEGEKVYLAQEKWDCGWYWGFGYVQTYEPRKHDMNSHQHFEGLFLKGGWVDTYKAYFKEVTLSDKEIWSLLELMKSFYTLRDMSDLCHTHGAHITLNKALVGVDLSNEYNRINKELLPLIFKQVNELLGG